MRHNESATCIFIRVPSSQVVRSFPHNTHPPIRCYSRRIILVRAKSSIFLLSANLSSHTHLSVDAYSPYLYPPMAIWGIDRALRILRQVYCNLHVKLSGSVAGTESTAHYDTETNVIRLEVIPGSRILSPQSGQHYFIYQPLRWRGWENHPFTLASWSELGSSDIDAEVTARHGDLTKHPIGKKSEFPRYIHKFSSISRKRLMLSFRAANHEQ